MEMRFEFDISEGILGTKSHVKTSVTDIRGVLRTLSSIKEVASCENSSWLLSC